MTDNQWQAFEAFRNDFRQKCDDWDKNYKNLLASLQKEAAQKDTPEYKLETCVVYNRALDDFTPQSNIKLIVIGDNPGKDEQLLKNNRYLVGQSGKIAANWFAREAELATDFRKNVIILNKTPVHTAKTAHLKFLAKMGGPVIQNLILESQKWMAERTALLHQLLSREGNCQLWLVGYAELKGRGIFLDYRDYLKAAYKDGSEEAWQQVKVYQHFSMNRFLIDLRNFQKNNPRLSLKESLEKLGDMHRKEIFD